MTGAEIGIPYMDKRYQAAELAMLEDLPGDGCAAAKIVEKQTITTRFSGLKIKAGFGNYWHGSCQPTRGTGYQYYSGRWNSPLLKSTVSRCS